ncbi:hypothetical protein [Halomonas sp. WWR20]
MNAQVQLEQDIALLGKRDLIGMIDRTSPELRQEAVELLGFMDRGGYCRGESRALARTLRVIESEQRRPG